MGFIIIANFLTITIRLNLIYSVYGRTGNPTRLFGKDIIKEAKQQINEKVVCLESIMGQLPLIPQTTTNDNNDRSVKVNMENKDVFIVHGHDSGLKKRLHGL